MRLSLAVGLLMLVGKAPAYFMTHSAAIFSDAAESVVHVVAVVFAAFSLRLSSRPAEAKFLYGYDRIVYRPSGIFSSGPRKTRNGPWPSGAPFLVFSGLLNMFDKYGADRRLGRFQSQA
jgi:hypothetical protein